MPNVRGKKFPYTAAGKKAAKAYAKKMSSGPKGGGIKIGGKAKKKRK